MDQQKITKLSRVQNAVIFITVAASAVALEICSSYFHFEHPHRAIFMFLLPSMIVCVFICRNLVRQPVAQEFKDFLGILTVLLLTAWIPLLMWASMFHINNVSKDFTGLVVLIALLIFGSYSIILTMLLKRFGLFRTLI